MAKKPAVVLDTNVFVSGLLSPNGAPGLILSRFRNELFDIATSREQIREIQLVLRRPSLVKALPPGTPREVLRFFAKFKRLTRVYTPPQLTWDFGDRNDHFLLVFASGIACAMPMTGCCPTSGIFLA